MVKKLMFIIAALSLPAISSFNAGRNGTWFGGAWQSTSGGACTTQPTITGATVICSTGVAFNDTIASTNADSMAMVSPDTLPTGLSLTKTGASIGRISGTPTTIASLDTTRLVVYACSGDSTDTAIFIWSVVEGPVQPDSFTLDTNAVNGSITLSPAPIGGKYESGDTVILTADADLYYKFTGWSDSLTGTQNPDTLVMDTNKVVTATFVKDSVFIDSISPDSGVAGSIITMHCRGVGSTQGSSTITMGDSAMGTAQSWSDTLIVDTVPNIDTGWVDFIFTGHWNSDTLDSAFKVISAAVPDSFTVSTSTTGSGSGTVTKDPDLAKYESGDSVTVAAIAGAHASFQGWSGDTSTAADTLRFDVSKNWTLTAEFWADSFYVSVTDDANAQITFPDDSIGVYGDSIEVNLTVTAGYTGDWFGLHLGPGIYSHKIYMTKDTVITASSHALPSYTVDTTWGGYLSAWTVTGGLAHDSGSTVTMTATCEACSSFSGYTGDYTGSSTSASFTITGNMSIGAGCEWNGSCGGGSRLKFLRSRRSSLTIGTFGF